METTGTTQQQPVIHNIDNTIVVNQKEIHITQIIFRPVLKRIVVISDQLQRTIVAENAQYDAYKDYTDDQVIELFRTSISGI
jgi:hypothetical protein